MTRNEMFDSVAQPRGNLAGVFEHDGDTGYFYLYRTEGEEGRKVVAAIWILNGTPDFAEKDVAIRWDATESKVGLFVRQQLWAVFDISTGAKYGGKYCAGTQPDIPREIVSFFGLQ
jgi:hypothetical protein